MAKITYKLKTGKFLFYVFIGLSFSLNSYGETITLKNGKTVEGELLEKTDKYIKIAVSGVPITYYLDEIESISAKQEAPPVIKAGASSAKKDNQPNITPEQKSNTGWQEWYKNVSPYLSQVNAIASDFGKLQNEATAATQKMTQNKNPALVKIFMELKNKMSERRSDFNKLSPPQELQRYHTLVADALNNNLKIIDEGIAGNSLSVTGYVRNTITLQIEALKELLRVYAQHNVPKEHTSPVEQQLETLKRMFPK